MANGDELRNKKELTDIEREYASTLSNVFDLETQILKKVDDILERKKQLLLTEEIIQETVGKSRSITEDEFEELVNIHKKRDDILNTTVKQVRSDRQVNKTLKERFDTLTSGVQTYFQYLMESDKAIKDLILDFGVTGEKAETIRNSLQESAIAAANLGISVGELAGYYQTYANETGRVLTLTNEQVKAMATLEKGTGLAVGEASSLAGQFELVGMDLIQTAQTIEGIMDTTERMGVNTTKVLKAVGENFKRLQTYNFAAGVSGMGEMAAYAEKFKVDLNSSLGAAEEFRSLEGAIEGAANLQILGGEFAKLADPMQLLFESRNDLEAFNKRISEMTKGMATMVETADGFQFQLASPMARDMLQRAGEALGMTTEQMSEMAIQQAKINALRQDMIGVGYNKEQRELIEGMAQLNTKTGDFFVMIGNKKRNIADITAEELSMLKAEQATLEERAKAAQTFDQQFQIFMEQLKATGLPLLKGINATLELIQPFIKKVGELFESIPDQVKGMVGLIGGVITGGILLTSKTMGLMSGMKNLIGGGAVAGGLGGSKGGGAIGGATKGGSALGGLATGVGVGLAGLGVGSGVMLAAEGITKLANSLEKLDPTQVEALKDITETIGIITGIGAAAAIAITAFGSGAAAAAPGLLAFGGAVALVGSGIGIASWGIGKMSEGMATLMETAKPSDIFALAGGMTALAGASTLFINPLTIAGLGAMALSIGAIASHGKDMERVGNAFHEMGVVLSGTKTDFKDVANSIKTISTAEFTKGNIFNELATLLKQPLKVQFSEQSVGMNMNVNLNIDKNKLIAALNLNKSVPVVTKMAQDGQSAG